MNAEHIEDIVELSPLQQGMLFHALYDPGSALYLEQVIVPFDGTVVRAALERAWNCVAEADTVLRTSFHWQEADKPVQVVHRTAAVPVGWHDLSSLPAVQADAALETLLAADRERGFELQRAPLLRVMLVRLSGGHNRLVLSFHHIILDGWSLQTVVRQFSQAYAALCAGQAAALPRTRPYGEHIRWLSRQDLGRAQAYWRRAFEGCESACFCLPDSAGAAPSAAAGPQDYAEESFFVSAPATTRLREGAAAQKLTLNTLVQGAWALLVQRLTSNADTVFGVTVSGRSAEIEGIEQMVGLFINTVPLRTQVDPETSVTAWLRDLQRRQFEAREFDHSPLVQIRAWSGVPGSGPLFDTLLAFENYPVQATAAAGDAAASFVERTNYPLSAAVVPGPRLHLRLLYHRQRLAHRTVQHLGAQFERCLCALAAGGGRRIGELDLLTDADRTLVEAVNRTRRPYPAQATLAALWCEQVLAHPGAPALVFGARRLDCAALDCLASALARRLSANGVGRETPVAVLLERSVEFVVAVLAVAKTGGCYVPMDVDSPPARLHEMLRDVGARLVLSRRQHEPLVAGGGVAFWCVDEPVSAAAAVADAPGWSVDADRSAGDAACIMYTSGSTGRPKGIVVPQRAVVRLVRDTDYLALSPADRIGHLSSVAFDAATFEIWGALLNGACIVGIEREAALSPAVLAQTLRRHEVSVLFITTALFNQVAAEVPDAYASLRVLLFGGEAVDPKAVRSVLRAGRPGQLLHVYGPTECTTFATWHEVTELAPDATTVPIGRPIGNTTAWVVDAAGVRLPPLVPGELVLGGDGVARGYHGQPRATAERFGPDPYSDVAGARLYRTGDRVRWSLDGRLEFLGRYDQQVKLRGHRIEPGEIERCLCRHPGVRRAVVALRDDATGEPALMAWFVPKPGAPVGLQKELRQLLRESLPAYMQPAALQAVDALPLNRSGKLDRAALPDPVPLHDAASEIAETAGAGGGDIERALQALWRQVLGVPRVGLHDDFFELGGHSLRATQLVSRIRRELDVEMPLRQVFERPTVAGLAAWIRDAGMAERPAATIAAIPRAPRRTAPG